uniref:Peptidase S1 domain-containing protein n=1 Tax=Timema bartmani TaxID=61472 RepID=A0A7R9ER07_9NEOP|nr:unnamed protein product [Timema bartmani]
MSLAWKESGKPIWNIHCQYTRLTLDLPVTGSPVYYASDASYHMTNTHITVHVDKGGNLMLFDFYIDVELANALVVLSPTAEDGEIEVRISELKEVPDDSDKNLILNLVQVHYNLTEDVNNSTLSTTVEPATTLESSLLVEEFTTVEPEPFNDTCGCAVCGVPNRKQRIVGGHVTKPNEFPWVVAMYKRGRFYCGGTLITRRHVLTAAHCVLK